MRAELEALRGQARAYKAELAVLRGLPLNLPVTTCATRPPPTPCSPDHLPLRLSSCRKPRKLCSCAHAQSVLAARVEALDLSSSHALGLGPSYEHCSASTLDLLPSFVPSPP